MKALVVIIWSYINTYQHHIDIAELQWWDVYLEFCHALQYLSFWVNVNHVTENWDIQNENTMILLNKWKDMKIHFTSSSLNVHFVSECVFSYNSASSLTVLVISHYGPGDELLHDLVAAAIDGLHARVHEGLSYGVLPHVAPAAVHLQTRGRHFLL